MYGGKTIKGLLFAVLFELAVIALLLRQTWYKSDANPVETFSADPPDHTRVRFLFLFLGFHWKGAEL